MMFFLLKILSTYIDQHLYNIMDDYFFDLTGYNSEDCLNMTKIEDFMKTRTISDDSYIPKNFLFKNNFYISSVEYYCFKYLYDKNDKFIILFLEKNNNRGIIKIYKDKFYRNIKKVNKNYPLSRRNYFKSDIYDFTNIMKEETSDEKNYKKFFKYYIKSKELLVNNEKLIFDFTTDEFKKHVFSEIDKLSLKHRSLLCQLLFDLYLDISLCKYQYLIKNDIEQMISNINVLALLLKVNINFRLNVKKFPIRALISFYNYLKCTLSLIYYEYYIQGNQNEDLKSFFDKHIKLIVQNFQYFMNIAEINYIYQFYFEDKELQLKKIVNLIINEKNYYTSIDFINRFTDNKNQKLFLNYLKNTEIINTSTIFLLIVTFKSIMSIIPNEIKMDEEIESKITKIIGEEKIKYLNKISKDNNIDTVSLNIDEIKNFIEHYFNDVCFKKNLEVNEKFLTYRYNKILYAIFTKIRNEENVDFEGSDQKEINSKIILYLKKVNVKCKTLIDKTYEDYIFAGENIEFNIKAIKNLLNMLIEDVIKKLNKVYD